MERKNETNFDLSYESDGKMGNKHKHPSKDNKNEKEKDKIFFNMNQFSE